MRQTRVVSWEVILIRFGTLNEKVEPTNRLPHSIDRSKYMTVTTGCLLFEGMTKKEKMIKSCELGSDFDEV